MAAVQGGRLLNLVNVWENLDKLLDCKSKIIVEGQEMVFRHVPLARGRAIPIQFRCVSTNTTRELPKPPQSFSLDITERDNGEIRY